MPSLTRSGRPELQLRLEPTGGKDVDGVAGEGLDHGPTILVRCVAETASGDAQPQSARASSISVAEQLEHAPRSRLPVGRETPERRAAGENGAGAERQCLDHVGAAADAAVDVDLDPAVDGLDDLGQERGGRRDGVELTAAVIRDDDRVGAVLDCEQRVLAGLDPLQDERERGERRAARRGRPRSATDRSRRAARAASPPPTPPWRPCSARRSPRGCGSRCAGLARGVPARERRP